MSLLMLVIKYSCSLFMFIHLSLLTDTAFSLKNVSVGSGNVEFNMMNKCCKDSAHLLVHVN